MQNDFDGALKFVLAAEGGYVDDPDDPGGATNMGIEQPEYNTYRRSLGQPTQDVRDITVTEASTIYKSNYWEPVHGDYLLAPVAYALFDSAVNCGIGMAVSFLQEVLGIPTSYRFDDNTSAAYHNFVAEHTGLDLANGVLARRTTHYKLLVADNEELAKFLTGWLNRVEALSKLISSPGFG